MLRVGQQPLFAAVFFVHLFQLACDRVALGFELLDGRRLGGEVTRDDEGLRNQVGVGLAVDGIEANRQRAAALVEQSLAMCTSLAPLIGYDKAAEIAKESFKTGKTVRQLALEKKLMPEAELNKALDPKRMTQPQADMIGSGGG